MKYNATFQVEDVFSIQGRGTVVVGKLTDGLLRKGMKATVNGKQTEVMEIEINNQSIDSLAVGTPAGVLLSNLEKTDITKGNIFFI